MFRRLHCAFCELVKQSGLIYDLMKPIEVVSCRLPITIMVRERQLLLRVLKGVLVVSADLNVVHSIFQRA